MDAVSPSFTPTTLLRPLSEHGDVTSVSADASDLKISKFDKCNSTHTHRIYNYAIAKSGTNADFFIRPKTWDTYENLKKPSKKAGNAREGFILMVNIRKK